MRDIEAIEMLGLPGIGKSFLCTKLREKLKNSDDSNIEVGLNFSKLVNTVSGVMRLGVAPLIWALPLLCRRNCLQQLKLVVVIYERAGRAKTNSCGILDEGVYQALWAIMWRCEKDIATSNLENIVKLLTHLKVRVPKVYYVYTTKKLHERLLERDSRRFTGNEKFKYKNTAEYENARRMMATLLRLMKRNDVRIIPVMNSQKNSEHIR